MQFKRQEFSARAVLTLETKYWGTITAVRDDHDATWIFKKRYEYVECDKRQIDKQFEDMFQLLQKGSLALDQCDRCGLYLEAGVCMRCDKSYELRALASK